MKRPPSTSKISEELSAQKSLDLAAALTRGIGSSCGGDIRWRNVGEAQMPAESCSLARMGDDGRESDAVAHDDSA